MSKKTIILGIETSGDETAAAIIEDNDKLYYISKKDASKIVVSLKKITSIQN